MFRERNYNFPEHVKHISCAPSTMQHPVHIYDNICWEIHDFGVIFIRDDFSHIALLAHFGHIIRVIELLCTFLHRILAYSMHRRAIKRVDCVACHSTL